MQFEGFLKIRTYNGSTYIWEDFTSRLMYFTEITESGRDPRTGQTSASSFQVIVDNKDGFWFAPEKATAQGKRLNDGDDLYIKTLRHRRIRVGIYNRQGLTVIEQPWATGRIKSYTANVDDGTVTLECETIEAEAMELLLDAKSGVDAYGDYYGIRGHQIEWDGDFEDTEDTNGYPVYPVYKRKETYADSDDYTTAIDFYRAVRVDAVLQRSREVLDVADETPSADTVLRKAYKVSSSDQSLMRRRATDQVQVLDNSYFADAGGETSFLLTMADPDGNICMIHENASSGVDKTIYLSYYSYRTNIWRKYLVGVNKFTNQPYCDIPARAGARMGWYNSYTKTFQWIGTHTSWSQEYIWEYNPATDGITSRRVACTYLTVTVQGATLCFAQTTTNNSGKGSIFIFVSPSIPGNSKAIVELDVSDIGTSLPVLLGPIQDPNYGRGDQPPNPGRETYCEWGMVNAVVSAASCYDTKGTCSTSGNGLIVAVDRSLASPSGYLALWIDLYDSVGNGAGAGYLIWGDISAGTDKVSLTQRPFSTTDPDGNHAVIIPAQKASGDNYTILRVPDAAWSTDNPSASGAVSGNGETKHAYFDENGGQGVVVPAEYEDLEEGATSRYDRFYFWANRYYGANGPGKLQSTDGKTLRAENTAIDKARYGDIMFGDFPNAFVATGLAFTTGRDGTLIVLGGFYNSDDDPDTNYLFVYGWDIQWTLPLLDVRNLSIAVFLSNVAQLTGYDWWFGARGELNFLDRRPDTKRNEYTLTQETGIDLASPGFDYNEIINTVKITPYLLTYQDALFLEDGNARPFYRQQTPNKTYLKYITVLPTCTEHVKVKVQISGVSPDRYKVYEYNDTTSAWDEIDSGTTKTPGSDWVDPSGKYSIPGTNWDITNVAALGDYWLFWTHEPLWGLEPLDASANIYEAIDLDSEKKYGKATLQIANNRFITRKDADLVANRILMIAKDVKRIFQVELPLLDEVPAIGDTIYLEDAYFQIGFTQAWVVIGRSKRFKPGEQADGAIGLRIEEVLS